jgi:type II secretory pathway pseudopilin PulG
MKPRARRGMTLLELVIGLTITVLMATAGAYTFAQIVDHRTTVRQANAATERAAALRETIRAWGLNGNVRVELGGGPRGMARSVVTATRITVRAGNTMVDLTPAKHSGDHVTIVTSAITPTMLPNTAIRLYIDIDEKTPEKGLTMEYQPNALSGLARKMLDSTITGLLLEYLDGRTQRWMPSSEAATLGSLRAVRITLAPGDSSVASRLLSVPLTFSMSGAGGVQVINR